MIGKVIVIDYQVEGYGFTTEVPAHGSKGFRVTGSWFHEAGGE